MELHFVAVDELAPIDEGDLAILDDHERRVANAFRRSTDRARYVVAHASLRRLLARHDDGDPAGVTFARATGERPIWLARATQRRAFSLSKCKGGVAMALAIDGDVGVDVSRIDVDTDATPIVARSFSPAERTDDAHEPETFHARWTIKEAYAKARGLGLALPLDATTVTFPNGLDAPTTDVAFDARLDDAPTRWTFLRFRPSPVHRVAIAVTPRCDPSSIALTVTRARHGVQ